MPRIARSLLVCVAVWAASDALCARERAPPDPWMAFTVSGVTVVEQKRAHLPSPQGTYVHVCGPGSMCEAAGLRPDDVVLEIDGRPPGAPQQLLLYVSEKRPGQPVQFKVWRDRQAVDVDRSMGGRGDVSAPVSSAAAAPTVASEARASGTAPVPPAVAVANPPPALEVAAVTVVPGQVAAGGKFTLEVTFTAHDAELSATTLPVAFRYSIEKGGQTLFAPDPEIVNAANGQRWRVVRNLAATREAGQYTLRVELSHGSDRAQATTTLTVN